MSAAHTEERLIVKDTWLIPESHTTRKIGGSTNKDRDFNDYAHIVCTVNGRHRNNAADARRLAACWNAMHAFSTEEIEHGVDLVERLLHGMEARVDLAAARKLLTEVIGIGLYEPPEDEMQPEAVALTDRIRAFLKGGAA